MQLLPLSYNKSKMADDAKIVNLKSLVDVKNMELNRQNLMLEEYHKKFQRANELNEALKDKINVRYAILYVSVTILIFKKHFDFV